MSSIPGGRESPSAPAASTPRLRSPCRRAGLAQHSPECLARRLSTVGSAENRPRAPAAGSHRESVPRPDPPPITHLPHFRLPRLLDRRFDQVANHRLDVAADVADFGQLRRLDLDERRVAPACASRRAISVLPTPVGPITRIFFGMISCRRGSRPAADATIAKRDRDRALSASCPTICS